MTDPNPATFDIADLFTGKAYPKAQVKVYLDEEAAFEIAQNAKAITQALVKEDLKTLGELEKRHEELSNRAGKATVEFHLTGVSRGDRKALLEKITEEHPPERNFMGQAIFNDAANEAHSDGRWALHTERIVRPDGSQITAPTPEQIRVFRNNAPDTEVEKIEKAILEFTEGVKSGFETLVQETDFLSQP